MIFEEKEVTVKVVTLIDGDYKFNARELYELLDELYGGNIKITNEKMKEYLINKGFVSENYFTDDLEDSKEFRDFYNLLFEKLC